MANRLTSLADITPFLAAARSLYVSGCAAQIPGLEQVRGLVEGEVPLTVSGIFVPGLNTLDYAGALGSPGGRSIIALNATAAGGAQSRIVAQLEGAAPSVSFTDADTVVTEFGIAELRGKSLARRVEQMIGIADPRHREALAAAARALFT